MGLLFDFKFGAAKFLTAIVSDLILYFSGTKHGELTVPATTTELDITISTTEKGSGNRIIVASATDADIYVSYDGSTNTLIFSSDVTLSDSSVLLNDGKSHRIKYKEVDGIVYLYIDGDLVTSLAVDLATVVWGYVGTDKNKNNDKKFKGSIIELDFVDADQTYTVNSGNTDYEPSVQDPDVKQIVWFNVEEGDWVAFLPGDSCLIDFAPIALWKMDEASGSIFDTITEVWIPERNGGKTYSLPALGGIDGTSIQFDGSGYFGYPEIESLQILGDLSVTVLINITTDIGQGYIAGMRYDADTVSSRYSPWNIRVIDGLIYYNHRSTSAQTTFHFGYKLEIGVDYYVTLTRNSSTKTITFYINGTEITSVGYLTNPDGGSDTLLGIGGSVILSTSPFEGYLDQLAIFDKVIPDTTADCYGVTPISHPASCFKELGADHLWMFDTLSGLDVVTADIFGGESLSIEYTTPGVGITFGEAPLLGLFDSSVFFDGEADNSCCLLNKSSTDALLINGDMTIAFAINIGTNVGNPGYIAGHGSNGTPDIEEYNWSYQYSLTTGDRITCYHESGNGVNNSITFTKVLTSGIDYQITIVRNTTTKTYSLYIDNVFEETLGFTNNPTGGTNNLNYFCVGGDGISSTTVISAHLDQLAIFKRALTETERGDLYLCYRATSDQCLLVSEPLALWNMNEASGSIVDEVSGYSLAPNFGTPEYLHPPLMELSGNSVYFDGLVDSSQYFGWNNILPIVGDLTISFAMKLTSISGSKFIVGKFYNGASPNATYAVPYVVRIYESNIRVTHSSLTTWQNVYFPYVLQPDTEYQITICRDVTLMTYTLYINGYEESIGTFTQLPANGTSTRFSIGGTLAANNSIDGWIDSMAIYDKVVVPTNCYSSTPLPVNPEVQCLENLYPYPIALFKFDTLATATEYTLNSVNPNERLYNPHNGTDGTTFGHDPLLGLTNKSVHFDRSVNTDAMLRSYTGTSMGINGDLTLSFAVNLDADMSTSGWLLTYSHPDISYEDHASYSVNLSETGVIKYKHENTSNSNVWLTYATTITLGTAYHLGFVRDSVAKTVKLYINGAYAETQSYVGDITLNTSSYLCVGGYYAAASAIKGYVDELAIYDTALSDMAMGHVYDCYRGTPFITTWETTGVDEVVTLPLRSGYNYDFDIDWGDGSDIETVTAYNVGNTHEYATADTYDISIIGTCDTLYFNLSGDRLKIKDVKQWGTNVVWTSLDSAFQGCTNLDITATDAPNISNCTNVNQLFYSAGAGKIYDLSGWDMSSITTLYYGFRTSGASATLDVTGCDFSNVTNWHRSFENATVTGLGTVETHSNLTALDYAFVSTTFTDTPDLSNFDTVNVTNMEAAFEGSNFAGSISGWDVGKVENFAEMFKSNNGYSENLSSWDTSSATAMYSMFYASDFNGSVTGWDVSGVTSFASMFAIVDFNQPLSSWVLNTTSAVSLSNMFRANDIFNQDLSSWDFRQVNNMTLFIDGNDNYSQVNYDKLLIRLDALGNSTGIQSGVTMRVSTTYSASSQDERDYIDVTKGWTISDEGQA